MSKYQFTQAQYEEIIELMRTVKEKTPLKKLQVLQLRMEGYKDREIAEITKYCKGRVSEICCEYAKNGIAGFLKENRSGGNNRNMTIEEEAKILEEFKATAEAGTVITVNEIKSAYEEKAGHTIGSGQIYRVLDRHGWRKVMPRSKHPNKASDEEIESSKKLTAR